MHIIETRNVHSALPVALEYLDRVGIERESRNGKVRMAPWPVVTVYSRPMERVLFWPERDANPFFHLYEALWMLQGRKDVTPLLRYAKQMDRYSDDGVTLWGAYGHRWRHQDAGWDQLPVIAERLTQNPDDRRCVLEMWSAQKDLGRSGKDVPCNVTATFQRNDKGELEATVFNRSNDILWGAYGANAVQFSLLQEFLALWIGCPVGVYRQISVNWHAYLTQGSAEPLSQVAGIPRGVVAQGDNPYANGKARWVPMLLGETGPKGVQRMEKHLSWLMREADTGFKAMYKVMGEPFFDIAYHVLYAHHCYKTEPFPTKFTRPLDVLSAITAPVDWKVAAWEWILRRKAAWEEKQ